MTREFINFNDISRESWQELHQHTKPLLTAEELEAIKREVFLYLFINLNQANQW